MDYANQGMRTLDEQHNAKYHYAQQTRAIASLNALDPPAPRATAQQALDEQEKYLGQLHTTISDLESRLNVVLGPHLPSAVGEGQSPTSANLLDRIAQFNRSIGAATNRLNDVMQRLQV